MSDTYDLIGTKCLFGLLREWIFPTYVVVLTNGLRPKRILLYILKKGAKKFLQKFLEISKELLRVFARKYLGSLVELREYQSIKEIMVDYPISVIRVASVNEPPFIDFISTLGIDLIITCSFREILRDKIIKIPSIGCINIHPSLLPKYRGIDPVFWALYNQERHTGITIHEITSKIDAGGIFAQRNIPIHFSDSEYTLRGKLGEIAAVELVNLLKNDRIKDFEAVHQNEEFSSYQGEPTIENRKELRKRRKICWNISISRNQ